MYTLLTNKNTEIAKLVKILVHNNEYSLIKDMINYNLFDDVVNIDINTNDNEIIRSIENIKNLKKVTVYN